MKLLLDTHILLWTLYSPARLSPHSREAIENGDNERFVSYAALWELSSKASRGKLAQVGSVSYVLSELPALRAQTLRIRLRDILTAENLPQLHSDPFDRIQVAQALREDLVWVTADREMRRYDVPILW